MNVNFGDADASDSDFGYGNVAKVAWEMTKYLQPLLPPTPDADVRIKAVLDLYADCHAAARGSRGAHR